MPVNEVDASALFEQQADDALVGRAASLGRTVFLRVASPQAERRMHQRREAIDIDCIDLAAREHA